MNLNAAPGACVVALGRLASVGALWPPCISADAADCIFAYAAPGRSWSPWALDRPAPVLAADDGAGGDTSAAEPGRGGAPSPAAPAMLRPSISQARCAWAEAGLAFAGVPPGRRRVPCDAARYLRKADPALGRILRSRQGAARRLERAALGRRQPRRRRRRAGRARDARRDSWLPRRLRGDCVRRAWRCAGAGHETARLHGVTPG